MTLERSLSDSRGKGRGVKRHSTLPSLRARREEHGSKGVYDLFSGLVLFSALCLFVLSLLREIGMR